MKQALLIIDAQQELIEGNDQEVSVFQKEKLILIKKAGLDRCQDQPKL